MFAQIVFGLILTWLGYTTWTHLNHERAGKAL